MVRNSLPLSLQNEPLYKFMLESTWYTGKKWALALDKPGFRPCTTIHRCGLIGGRLPNHWVTHVTGLGCRLRSKMRDRKQLLQSLDFADYLLEIKHLPSRNVHSSPTFSFPSNCKMNISTTTATAFNSRLNPLRVCRGSPPLHPLLTRPLVPAP